MNHTDKNLDSAPALVVALLLALAVGHADAGEPVCPFKDAAHCQFRDEADPVLRSDRRLGVRRFDDFRPESPVIDRTCWEAGFFPPFGSALPPCDTDPPNRDDWEIHFYENDFGLPGMEIGPVGGYAPVPDAEADTGFSIVWEFSAPLKPPLAVVPGECYWIEITGNGTEECNVGWMGSHNGNDYSMGVYGGVFGQEYYVGGIDCTFCLSSAISPAVEPGVDGGCGDIPVACCTPLDPPECEQTTISQCRDYKNWPQPGRTCGVDGCLSPENDNCDGATVICAGPGEQNRDPDIGVCTLPDAYGNPVVCLKSSDPLGPELDTICQTYYEDLGSCTHIAADTFRCTVPTDNRLATTDGPIEGSCAFKADVWYRYTAPCTGAATITMCGADTYDGVLEVFTSGAETCPTCPITTHDQVLACNDDGFCSPGLLSGVSGVRVEMLEDVCYLIRVGGFGFVEPVNQAVSELDIMMACFPLLRGVPPHNIRKNRFLSFMPKTADTPVALRVELVDLRCRTSGEPCNDDADCLDGDTCVEPRVCADGILAGQPCTTSADCDLQGSCEPVRVMLGWVGDPFEPGTEQTPPGTVTSLVVKDQPPLRVWTDDVIHIGDCEIAPARDYAISTTVDGVLFSLPLIIGTIKKPDGKFWGDVVGEFDGAEWTAPNGLVNVNDIIAWINFVTFRPAPHITVLDLANEVPNFVINATDLTLILQGFQSKPYPPPAFPNQGSPADCP